MESLETKIFEEMVFIDMVYIDMINGVYRVCHILYMT